MPCPFHSSRFYHPHNSGWGVQIMKLLIMQFSPFPVIPSLLGPNILNTLFANKLSWRTTPCRLSATAYSIYSQLPSILEAVAPSATWGRAVPWWRGPLIKWKRYMIREKIYVNSGKNIKT
jgi:hypothetical protein